MPQDLFLFDQTHAEPSPWAGVDEAGRGPWAGPVVAAAVILPKQVDLPGLNDSKLLTPTRRAILFNLIQERALAVSWAEASAEEIDRLNILQATFLAMRRALDGLSLTPRLVRVDGNLTIPGITPPQEALIGGDGLSASIAAASIIAKVVRDRRMLREHAQFPHYGFDRHKGYGTPDHQVALKTFGPCPLHRRSFSPVRNTLTPLPA